MAGLIYQPGTPEGPCATPCDHPDCQAQHAIAAKDCAICATPIGYGAFYVDGDTPGDLLHAACTPDAAARMRAALERQMQPRGLDHG